MTPLKIASTEESNKYIKEGKKWLYNHPEWFLLQKTKMLPYIAAAEYIANQDKKTILIIKEKKVKNMSELLKRMRTDLTKAMKKEVELRKTNINTGLSYETTISIKQVIRSIISMFPEIGMKPNDSTDADVIKLLKKYIASEKIRELYIQHILSGTKVMGLSSKELNKLQKEKIAELDDKLSSIKIEIAQTYLPKEPSIEEINKWIEENINFDDYKNPIQAMGKIMQHFKGVDGNKIKQLILSI